MENTMLSKTELKVLAQLARGSSKMIDIAKALRRSNKQIYRCGARLAERGFVTYSKGVFQPTKMVHTNLLLQVLSVYPNVADLLCGPGISVLTELFNKKSVAELAKETGFKRSTIYNKIKKAMDISVVRKQKEYYMLNEKLWDTLEEFLAEYKKYIETTDSRVPANSIIYHKTDKEIIFSNKSEIDANLTAFSAFEQYGIKIFSPACDYYLPKRKLSKKEVFRHSLYIAEKDKDIRSLTYIALFYIKFKKELCKVHHPIIDNIKRVLRGEKINEYPSFEEIKEKAEVYDIKF